MTTFVMYAAAIISVAIVIFMLIKKMDIKITLFLLATLYPILIKAGMSSLTAAGIIATTATIVPTPLGSDNVAIAAELANTTEFAGLKATDYVFKYHAIVSIPTLLIMAAIHFFWQKRCDKKAGAIEAKAVESKDVEEIKGGVLYKTVYAILPLLPIILLIGSFAVQKITGAHTELISRLPGRNGHAIIQKQPNGQNCILLYGGSNQQNTRGQIDEVMSHFEKGDYLILQNEINEISYIMERAHEKGMIIVLNPSPMDEKIRTYPLEYVDYFLLNEIEAKDLTGFDQNLADTDQHRVQEMDEVSSAWDALLEEVCSHFPNSKVVLTLGEYGSIYKDEKQKIHQPIMKVPVVDTTAAGDTFTGFFIGSIARGLSPENAMKIAAKASAIAVSRQGAAPSIPELGEVERDMTL